MDTEPKVGTCVVISRGETGAAAHDGGFYGTRCHVTEPPREAHPQPGDCTWVEPDPSRNPFRINGFWWPTCGLDEVPEFDLTDAQEVLQWLRK